MSTKLFLFTIVKIKLTLNAQQFDIVTELLKSASQVEFGTGTRHRVRVRPLFEEDESEIYSALSQCSALQAQIRTNTKEGDTNTYEV